MHEISYVEYAIVQCKKYMSQRSLRGCRPNCNLTVSMPFCESVKCYGHTTGYSIYANWLSPVGTIAN